MSDATDPKSTLELGSPTAAVTRTDSPPQTSQAGDEKPFKFKLSLPGKDIGGDWLCKNSGDALAYKSYAVPDDDSVRKFRWVPYKGETFLQDQDGNWLSYESIWGLLYMSTSIYAVAWQFKGNHLVRTSDGAVLSWYYNARWPFASRKNWLSASPMSKDALTVEMVEE